MYWRIAYVMAASLSVLAGQNHPATILEVDIENFVFYYLDVTDPAKLATSATPVPTGPGRVFRWQVAIGDVIAVNGKPARGLYAGRSMPLTSTTRLTPGQAIADVGSFGLNDVHLVILDAEGKEIGSIFGVGVGGAAPPPGAPAGAGVHNYAVVGGTGAFLGVRGQWSFRQSLGGTSRAVSMAEDPAYRRTNGGSSRRDIIHLIPMTSPALLALPSGPAIYHGVDFSPVTSERAARVGEQLILAVSGLGPVRPNLPSDRPFPPLEEGKAHEVNSPVAVTVNGKPATVVNKIGCPGLNNVYRVDFVVPDGTPPGMATLGLSAAWISAPEIRFPVR